MSINTKPSKILFALGSFYTLIYSIFLLSNFLPIINSSSLEPAFYIVILITLVGVWSLWNQKKIFSPFFWKYFLIFQIIFSLVYFYVTYNLENGINLVFISKIILFAPLCIITYLYTFKNYDIWNIAERTEIPSNKSLKNNLIFFIGLILITLVYNPFPQAKMLTPAEYNTLAYLSSNKGDSVAPRRFYMKGLKSAKKLHQENTPVVAKIYSNLGIYYDARFNHKAADYYTLRSIYLYEKLLKEKQIGKLGKDYHILGEDYYSIGTSDIKDYSIRLSYLNKALKLFTLINDGEELSKCYQALGSIYSDNKDYKLSKENYDKSISMAQRSNTYYVLSTTYLLYADSFFEQRKYNEAEKYAKMAIDIFKKNGIKNLNEQYHFGNSYVVLAKIYAAEGKCKEAIEYYSIGVPIVNKSANRTSFINKLIIDRLIKECKAPKMKG